jgi:uncharacterized protein (DUF1800 family)
MALQLDPQFEHLLRRAGFGARPDEIDLFRTFSIRGAVEYLLDYEDVPDDVDSRMGQPGYVGVGAQGRPFDPAQQIADARQRWLFRMVHTNRPLQEKMTLFWHNHFATAYLKVAGFYGAAAGTIYLAAKESEGPLFVDGQIETLRKNALGNFRDILVLMAQDVAMLEWLDGRQNTRTIPQENFGRELMELFTMGVGNYTEDDVYAAARVFTGWNLVPRTSPARFSFIPGNHDATAKTFTFPIYPDGGRTIPARAAASGMQDGIDLINALAASPITAKYLATKLYRFFVSESGDVSESFVNDVADVYLRSRYNMKAVMREVLLSREFWDRDNYFTRYSWPVEFVVRTLKDMGWGGFALANALVPLGNMGQNLFEPPDVNGWDTGKGWFSSGSMLARMNFAQSVASSRQTQLAGASQPYAQSPGRVLSWALDSIRTAPMDDAVKAELESYLVANGPWTGSAAQLQIKVPGLARLIAGTPEYQLV